MSIVKIIFFWVMLFFLINCSSRDDSYLVGKNKVGLLTEKTKVYEIKNLFKKDSIVSIANEGLLQNASGYTQEGIDTYRIYNKSGKHLLTITAKEPSDSLSTIKCVEIFDKRYKTANGIGLDINFETLNAKTYIKKIESTFTKVILYLDEMGATMTLSKKDLRIATFDMQPIQKEQIPSLAKPQSFVIWF